MKGTVLKMSNFSFSGKSFYLDDKPFTVISGAMHYWRIVPEYWEDRLKKLINSDRLECRVILYDIFKDLEECCRETSDFKGAYEYSVGKVELLEHMLRY